MDLSMLHYDTMPLWLLGLLLFVALTVAREIGHALGERRRARLGRPGEGQFDDGITMASVLSLLALLIAFTFSLTLQRYDNRRALVIDEANALGTTWLRTQLLDEADRDRLQGLLRRYVDLRIEFGLANTPHAELTAYRRTEAMQQEIWTALMQAVAPHRTTPLAVMLVTTTNDAIDLAASRMAARDAHTPVRIMRILLIYALIAAGTMGYHKGRYRSATTVLFLLLTLAATLIADLDRPTAGGIQVSQQPMIDLQRSIAAPP
ncbi:hypothetical protein ACFPOA_14585 [Lysobacter niabensis]|uniref:bestrophin-like domain n=1 Tax=Agrilutibacter niabensis TaxID=380628 RepID=UPI00360C3E95